MVCGCPHTPWAELGCCDRDMWPAKPQDVCSLALSGKARHSLPCRVSSPVLDTGHAEVFGVLGLPQATSTNWEAYNTTYVLSYGFGGRKSEIEVSARPHPLRRLYIVGRGVLRTLPSLFQPLMAARFLVPTCLQSLPPAFSSVGLMRTFVIGIGAHWPIQGGLISRSLIKFYQQRPFSQIRSHSRFLGCGHVFGVE